MNWGLVAFVIVFQPIMTAAVAVVMRWWAEGVFSVLGQPVSERTKRRQRKELPWILALMYLVMIIGAFQRHWH